MVKRFSPPVKLTLNNRASGPGKKGVRQNLRNSKQSLLDASTNLNAFMRHIEKQSPTILHAVMSVTFAKSQKWCPSESGALKRSGFVEIVNYARGPAVVMGYGKPTKGEHVDYAPFVHERVDLQHTPPTRAKFLEAAVTEDIPKIRERVAKALEIAAGLTGGPAQGTLALGDS